MSKQRFSPEKLALPVPIILHGLPVAWAISTALDSIRFDKRNENQAFELGFGNVLDGCSRVFPSFACVERDMETERIQEQHSRTEFLNHHLTHWRVPP